MKPTGPKPFLFSISSFPFSLLHSFTSVATTNTFHLETSASTLPIHPADPPLPPPAAASALAVASTATKSI
ncbi:unnamed protein product [Linum trigynum]|uniref:Secreted protein n=1 Tax=Linum trigynum TaxID=586398 RepID=A0AAV2EQV0_9ROSI